MATDQQLHEVRTKIVEAVKALLEAPVQESAVRGSLGEVNFAVALPVIGRVRDLLILLAGSNLDYISYGRLTLVQTALKEIGESFDKIRNFDLNVANPSQQRDNTIEELRNRYESWFDAVHPVMAFAIRNKTDFDQIERELRDKLAKVEDQSALLLQETKTLAAEAESVVSSIKKAAAQAGVAQEAVHFKVQADEHKKAAWVWLVATIVVAIATVAWGAVALWVVPIKPGSDAAEIVQQALAKIIVFTGLYYALVWCARNYNASRHNYIVNKHRQNSLSTFESFVKAAEQDVAIKNAVLLQATTSIFGAQQSGYAGKEGESEEPVPEICTRR